MAAIRHLVFSKTGICNCAYGSDFRGSTCVIVQNFVLIGQTVAGILRFLDFFSKLPPSAILDLCACRTIHDEYLVVFITVQNLFGINAVVSIIGKCCCLTRGSVV